MTFSAQEIIRGALGCGVLTEKPEKGSHVHFSAFQIDHIRRWLKENPPIDEALNQAHLAIDEYYNGDRAWGERWLLRAHEANQEKAK